MYKHIDDVIDDNPKWFSAENMKMFGTRIQEPGLIKGRVFVTSDKWPEGRLYSVRIVEPLGGIEMDSTYNDKGIAIDRAWTLAHQLEKDMQKERDEDVYASLKIIQDKMEELESYYQSGDWALVASAADVIKYNARRVLWWRE